MLANDHIAKGIDQVDIQGKVAVVTGAAGGIGEALAHELLAEGAKVAVVDLDQKRVDAAVAKMAEQHAGSVIGMAGDVSSNDVIRGIIERTESELGEIDMYFANAGIIGPHGIGDSDDDWDQIIDVNVLAHVRAARMLVPAWVERGSGYFISTASAAGLLSQIGAAAYSTTKSAAVTFSEWLAITYAKDGIKVSCLCPMGVNTDMLNTGLESTDETDSLGARVVQSAGGVLEPSDVAKTVLQAVRDEVFLILPHEEVREYMRRKGSDHDRWLRGMARLQERQSR